MSPKIWTPDRPQPKRSGLPPAGDLSIPDVTPEGQPSPRILHYVSPFPDETMLRHLAQLRGCSLSEIRQSARESIIEGRCWVERPCQSDQFGEDVGLKVIGSVERTPHGTLLHVSVSYCDRDPSWREIKAVRAAFYPSSVDVMMMLPQARDYVNLHEHTFHLWQTPQPWGLR